MEIKTKINKWDLMTLESFCTAKETINNTKRPPYSNAWTKKLIHTKMTKALIQWSSGK